MARKEERGLASLKYADAHPSDYTNEMYDIVDIEKAFKAGAEWADATAWKPSDEQMKVLDEVLNFAANHESPYWNDYIFGTLNNLIRQLEKLKWE